MKVRELIELLSENDPELDVGFSYNYGDYWKTQVVETADWVSKGEVKWSERLDMNELVDNEDNGDWTKDPDNKMMVIIMG